MRDRSELLAIEIALDELKSYVDAVGNEADYDEDSGTQTGKLRWAIKKLDALIERESVKG